MITARKSNAWLVLVVLCLGSFMILLDSTIVYVAVPSILTNLHSSFDSILWVLNAYLITYSVLLIASGRMGDIVGPRNLFVAGLIVFTIASALCGLAQDASQLIAARILQGVGGALLAPQALAVITTLFPPNRRGAAFGIWSGVAGIATVVGPTLGGLIVTNLDWRWIFFLNVPIGILTIIASFVVVPDLRPGRRHRFDLVGVGLITASLLAITFALIEGQRYSWGAIFGPITIREFIGVGFGLLGIFVLWESRQTEPLVPLSLFRNRNFAAMNLVGMALSFGMQGVFLPVTIYLQSVLSLSALNAGLAIAPLTVISMFTAPMAGRLADRIGGKYILMVGLATFAGGNYWLAQVAQPTSSARDLLFPFLVAGAGLGMVFAPMASIALERITPAMSGAASGVLNTTRQLGFAMAAAVIGAVLQTQLTSSLHANAVSVAGQLPPALRPNFIDSFAAAAKSGFELGRGQAGGAALPPGLTPELKAQVLTLIHQVFLDGYVTAMRPTIAVASAVLLAAATGCLAVARRRRAAVQPSEIAESALALATIPVTRE